MNMKRLIASIRGNGGLQTKEVTLVQGFAPVTKRGAQMLLHARCALLNGELSKHSGWWPLESSPVQAVAA
jgi:hypothetical protein